MMMQNKKFFKVMLTIAGPIALQSLLSFSVNLIDTLMLGQLGEISISASSLGNQVFFIVTMVVNGIASGASVLISQYWGRKDMTSIRKILTYAYMTAIGFAVIAAFMAICMPGYVMRLFTTNEAVIAQGITYLRIVGWSYLFFTMTNVTTGILRAVHTVRIAMALSAVALCIKVSLNYVLIFGKLGAPELGIEGAAIVTLFVRIVECTLLIIFLIKKENKLCIIRHLVMLFTGKTEKSPSLMKVYLGTSIPVIINELFWALGDSVVAMILGRMGTEVVSANAIYINISQIASVLETGVTAAACVIVGNTIGAGEFGSLKTLKKQFQRVSVGVGLIAGTFMLICMAIVPDFYNVTEATRTYARQIMLVGAVVEVCKAIQIMNMMGILRGARDVKFAMLNDLLFLWIFTIPMGAMAGLVWGWPVPAVYAVLKFDQFLKIITSEARMHGKKWKMEYWNRNSRTSQMTKSVEF